MRPGFLIVLMVLLGAVAAAWGQGVDAEFEGGLPPWRRWAAPDGERLSAGLAVAPDGTVTVSTSDGILLLDGGEWRTLTGGGFRRSTQLTYDARGRLWTTGEGGVGYLSPGWVDGGPPYRSLLDELPAGEKRPDFLTPAEVGPDGRVILRAVAEVWEWSETGIRKVHTSRGFLNAAFFVGRRLYCTDSDHGLMVEAPGGGFRVVSGGEVFGGSRGIRRAIPVADDGAVLLVTAEEGLWILRPGEEAPERVHSDLAQPGRAVEDAAMVAGGGVVVLMRGGVLVALGPDGREVSRHSLAGLLAGEMPMAMAGDAEGGLWLVTRLDLYRFDLRSRLRVWGVRTGLPGQVMAVTTEAGRVVVATTEGTYESAERGFRPVPGAPGAGRQFARAGERLVLQSRGHLWESVGGEWVRRYEVPGRFEGAVHGIPGRGDLLLVATLGGLGRVRVGEGAWDVLEAVAPTPGFVVSFTDDPEGGVWVETGWGRVARWEDVDAGPATVRTYTTADGLPAEWVAPMRLGGGVVFRTHSGVYAFDRAVGRFERDGAMSDAFRYDFRSVYRTYDIGGGAVWVTAPEGNAILSPGKEGTWVWKPVAEPLLARERVDRVDVLPDGSLAVAVRQGLVKYDPRRPVEERKRAAAPRLRAVMDLGTGAVLHAGLGPAAPVGVLPWAQRSLRFEFGAPLYPMTGSVEYSVRLEGYAERWSEWSAVGVRDFTNLEPGPYRLWVRVRADGEATGEALSWSFGVAPPWWRTASARLVFASVSVLVAAGVVRLWTRALAARARWLERLVAERTEVVTAQAHELEQTNEKLMAAAAEAEAANQQLAAAVQALTETNRELDAVSREKDELMGIASHDLKNPLGGILTLTALLRESRGEMEPEEVDAQVAEIEGFAERMLELVRNLLDLSRLENGAHPVRAMDVDAREVLERVLAEHAVRVHAKGQVLTLEAPAALLVVTTDPMVLGQVLDNLVSNAVKYSPRGAPIVVRAMERGERVRIEVVDRGPGIAAEDRPKLFRKFARLAARPTGGESSTGLGLAIVKRLCELLRAEVGCDSEVGAGSTFWVEVPVAPGVPGGGEAGAVGAVSGVAPD